MTEGMSPDALKASSRETVVDILAAVLNGVMGFGSSDSEVGDSRRRLEIWIPFPDLEIFDFREISCRGMDLMDSDCSLAQVSWLMAFIQDESGISFSKIIFSFDDISTKNLLFSKIFD